MNLKIAMKEVFMEKCSAVDEVQEEGSQLLLCSGEPRWVPLLTSQDLSFFISKMKQLERSFLNSLTALEIV